MRDLSVLIPARNELFLNHTIADVLAHREADTEVIVVLDGAWPMKPIPVDDRLVVIHAGRVIGQRAATNLAARVSEAKYVMKLDAHCSVGQGFDRIMLEDIEGHPDWTMVPKMYNLHAFDWVCQQCGRHRYQSPSGPCGECNGPTERVMLWQAKPNPETTAMRFDRDLKFKYWSQYKRRQAGELVDTMSLLGACWMVERGRYHALNICDEAHGGWGQQGTEVACKSWLSGGRVVCNKKTWFAHMFRTQGGDFGFPYPLSSTDVHQAREYSKWLWRADEPKEMPHWDGAIYPLQWLIDRFAPVPEWGEDGGVSKGILYYTDNRLDPTIMKAVQQQLLQARLPIVSVSLEPIDFGRNYVVKAERGPLTMFRQILKGLKRLDTDVVFLAEHDVLYHPSHFEFTPPEREKFYYNNNIWRVDAEDGRALFHISNHTSQLVAYRELMIEHYMKRIALVRERGYSNRMGYEPGTHRRAERVDDTWHDTYMSDHPNLDLRHGQNLTPTRWKKEQFRSQRYTKGWTEADGVESWYQNGQIRPLLEAIAGEL